MLKKVVWVLVLGLLGLLLIGCTFPGQQPAGPPQVITVVVPATGQPTIVVTQIAQTVVVPTSPPPTATLEPAPPTYTTATVFGWAEGVRVDEQNVYIHPWSTSDIPFTLPSESTVIVYGKSEDKWGGEWICVSNEDRTLFGWMDNDQLDGEPALEDLEVVHEEGCTQEELAPG